jgi:phosphatidylglycerophosphate synthase
MSGTQHEFGHRPRASSERAQLVLESVFGAVLVVSTVALLAASARRALGFGPDFFAHATVLGAGGVGLALAFAPRHLPSGRLGPANYVTLLRGGLVAIVLALLWERAGDTGAWLAVGVATLVLGLDGLDGYLARHTRMASSYGARLDMETDAALILALAALAWHTDKAGAWVLASGLMRYAFLAAGRAWPALRRPLPASRRRQAVCVTQITCLLGCLVPWVARPWSAGLAAGGLALLAWSFAMDTRWLAHRAASEEE